MERMTGGIMERGPGDTAALPSKGSTVAPARNAAGRPETAPQVCEAAQIPPCRSTGARRREKRDFTREIVAIHLISRVKFRVNFG